VAATKQLEAGEGDAAYLRGKRLTARFFADHLLPQADSLAEVMVTGGALVRAAEEALV
ncbi:MAG: hypothetical protein C3F16_05605, partial [Betaproteobacteria bacterium]